MIDPSIKLKRRRFSTSLQTRIIILVCLLVLSLTLIAGGVYTSMINNVLEEQIGKRALQVANRSPISRLSAVTFKNLTRTGHCRISLKKSARKRVLNLS